MKTLGGTLIALAATVPMAIGCGGSSGGSSPTPTTCTSFTYSDWNACQQDGTQTRTVLSSAPAGCTGGSPMTTQACTYVPPTFSQADLVGTWDAIGLNTNDSAGWATNELSIDASGNATFNSCTTNEGACTVSGTVTFAIDGAGSISASGTAANTSFHGNMSMNRRLIFGTATSPATGAPSAYSIQIMRKRVPGVTYSSTDLRNLTFAYHSIYSGQSPGWERGAGAIDGAGQLSLTALEDSTGPLALPPPVSVDFNVDANGLVTISGNPYFHGVLTTDKKALFFVEGLDAFSLGLTALLVTGQTFDQGDMTGPWSFYMVTSGGTVASSNWVRGLYSVSAGGTVTFSTASNPFGPISLAPFDLVVGPGGDITRPDVSSYRGQMSDDRGFYVRTQTINGAESFGFGVR